MFNPNYIETINNGIFCKKKLRLKPLHIDEYSRDKAL